MCERSIIYLFFWFAIYKFDDNIEFIITPKLKLKVSIVTNIYT